jgi:adenylate cyclase
MASGELRRRLSAILSADVEGYSRLMREDEEATVRTLTTYRTALTHLIEKYRGRVVDAPGDNVLAEFGSVVDAVNCAVEIQRELAERNAELSENRRMRFRIGINLGDVLEEGPRIYGDGVNIAARMEGLAKAGEVCISGTVHDAIENKIGLEYEYLGEHQVKNIDKPVRAYRVLSHPGAAAHRVIKAKKGVERKWRRTAMIAGALVIVLLGAGAGWYWHLRSSTPPMDKADPTKMAFPLPDKPSIAVLPFTNMSGDQSQEFVVDGFTENLITALARIPQLFVVARNSTFTYKGKAVKVQQVAEELGVQYVLEGSFQRSGDKVRVTAQLIDALSGRHMWAAQFDREWRDLFKLTDEVVSNILEGATMKLGGWGTPSKVRGAKDTDTWVKFLEAVETVRGFNPKANARARILSQEIIVADPEWMGGPFMLAWTHLFDGLLGETDSPERALAKAKELAQRAISLDESSPDAHVLLGSVLSTMGDHGSALAELDKALTLCPNCADAHAQLALTRVFLDETDRAIRSIQTAIRLNPTPPLYYYAHLGAAHRSAGRYQDAAAAYERCARIEPSYALAQVGLASTYSLMGREEEARAAAKEALLLTPKFSLEAASKGMPYKNTEKRDRIVNALRKAGIPEKPPAERADVKKMVFPLPDKPSIAVLPFVNMSDDPKQEYFSDGMTEDLITDLSKVSGLFVIARNSTFTYKGKAVKIAQVAKELGVRYVLEGSVRKAGGRLRINAQLIDATTGGHLWSERYDGSEDDVFALQDQINQKIVAALEVKLTEREKALIAQKGTNNPAAYDEYLRGREQYSQFTKDGSEKAEACFKRALGLDPKFSQARAALAQMHYHRANLGLYEKGGIGAYFENRLLARHYLQEAMREPTSLAHSLAGMLDLGMREHDEAVSQLENALSLDPNDPLILGNLSWVLAMAGRPTEAMEHAKKGIRVDPINPDRFLLLLGVSHFCLGEWEQAAAWLEKALKTPGFSYHASLFLAATYVHLGRNEKARAAYEDYRKAYEKTYQGVPIFLAGVMQGYPFKDRRVAESFAEGLLKAGLPGRPSDYIHVSKEDRVVGEDLRALIPGSTLTGVGPDGNEWRCERRRDGNASYWHVSEGSDTGRWWIEGDLNCVQNKRRMFGMEYCYVIFRNPQGRPEHKDEYVGFGDTGMFTFSLVR